MSRYVRRLGLTTAGWLMLLALLAAVATCGYLTATAHAEDGERYVPSARGTRQAVQELAEAHFAPEWVGWAVRTAGCESGYDLYARSAGFDRVYGWYEHVGAFQISVPTWAEKARELFGNELSDPDTNFAMASWIVTNFGPSHWPYCGR